MATIQATCQHCGKTFPAQIKEVNRGNGKFCSRSCAAACGNILRKKEKHPNYRCACCRSEFYRKPSLIRTATVYCSKRCFYEATHPLYSRSTLVEIVQGFYTKKARIPLYEEFNSDPKYPNPETYKAAFGSWNAGIEAAGFDPNSSSLGRICLARDGHKCRSFAERIIDDWLSENGIEHQREVRYPGSNLRADWLVEGSIIEFLGIRPNFRNRLSNEYFRTLDVKRAICKTLGVELIEVYPEELFSLSGRLGQLMVRKEHHQGGAKYIRSLA